MKNIYQFNNWASASKMKNEINPDLAIDVEYIMSDNDSLAGYSIIVYSRMTNRVIYKFYIDVVSDNNWSLTTDKAIDVLNSIGFPCEYIHRNNNLSDKAIEILESLSNLGYKTITRSSVIDCHPEFILDIGTVNTSTMSHVINNYSYEYYSLFRVLRDDVVYSITDLINNN